MKRRSVAFLAVDDGRPVRLHAFRHAKRRAELLDRGVRPAGSPPVWRGKRGLVADAVSAATPLGGIERAAVLHAGWEGLTSALRLIGNPRARYLE